MIPNFHYDVKQHLFDPANPYEYQTNPEWLDMRADRFTASHADELLVSGKDKDGLGKTIKTLINNRVMQRLTGWIDDSAVSWQEKEAVRRGIIYEDEARKWYERQTGLKVVECGFVERGEYIGCSPDGLVPEQKRMIQIKIPMPVNFINMLHSEAKEFTSQCEMELFVCDYEQNDLVVYSPELGVGRIFPVKRNKDTDAKILSKMRAAAQYRDKTIQMISNVIQEGING